MPPTLDHRGGERVDIPNSSFLIPVHPTRITMGGPGGNS